MRYSRASNLILERPTSGQGGKSPCAARRAGNIRQPGQHPDDVKGHRCDDVLQPRFRQPTVACLAQPRNPYALRQAALHAGSNRILACYV